jgi:hypothetical protein
MRKYRCLSVSVACLALLTLMQRAPLLAVSSETRVLELVNNERARAGVPPLVANSRLVASARKYALYLGQACFFGHVGPDGSTLVTRNVDAGYRDAIWLGENIAAGYSSPESVVDAWMKSSAHRSNILDPNFTETGISNVDVGGSPYCHYWVQEFGLRNGSFPGRISVDPRVARREERSPVSASDKGVVSAGGLQGKRRDARSEPVGKKIPVITGIKPTRATQGAVVAITGCGFGVSGKLRFGGLVANAEFWSDTMVICHVPKGAISAGVTVANSSGIISRGVGFRVITRAPSPLTPQKHTKFD